MLESANHCVYDVKYHMALCVKYRKKLLLTDEVVGFLFDVFKGLEERYFLAFETIGCDKDHCHVLVRAKPRYAPSRVMRVIKSVSARKLFEKFKWIKTELWGGVNKGTVELESTHKLIFFKKNTHKLFGRKAAINCVSLQFSRKHQ